MVRIAVTGGIACGKSTAGGFIEQAGVPVCDADDIAHRVMREDQAVRERIVSEFGRRILGADGHIDRRILGSLVFAESAARERLNAIVHPAVKAEWERWVVGKAGGSAAAVIIPLLYEVREERNWNVVLCVACAREDQVRRMRDRGLSDSEIEARLAGQMAVAEKMERADYVIFNGGSIEALKDQTMKVVQQVVDKHDA
jgi:dephospho-CoA kinase